MTAVETGSTPDCTARFEEYRRSRDRRVRNELVELHRDLAVHLARRYRNRGEPLEDLLQVAMLGLLKAVERFEPDRGIAFVSFAGPTIAGELKRHFRDTAWTVRVPRRLQERALDLTRWVSELSQRFGRSPTVEELAAWSGHAPEDVLEAMEASRALGASPLDERGDDGTEREVRTPAGVSALAESDPGLAFVERRMLVGHLLDSLPERQRRILFLRFFAGMTQSEIARELGISQMHVSRLGARALVDLRRRVGDDILDAVSL